MEIVRRELKGLARILGPLALWMSLGWALFPTLMQDISIAAGESINMQEVELFSMIMFTVCLALGLIFTVFGYINRFGTKAK